MVTVKLFLTLEKAQEQVFIMRLSSLMPSLVHYQSVLHSAQVRWKYYVEISSL